MKIERFVQKIATLAPSEKELLDYGLDTTEVAAIRDLFLFESKNRFINDSEKELFSFFENFNTSKKEVGGISFFNEIIKEQNQFIFARLESDLFFQDSKSDKIYLRDENNKVLFFVCNDFESFLDIVYSSAFFKRSRKKENISIKKLKSEILSNLMQKNKDESNVEFLNILFRE